MRTRSFVFRCLWTTAFLAAVAGASVSAHDIMLGVGTHFINRRAGQPGLFDLVQEVGADSVRADTGWKFVETEKGVYKIPPTWDQFVNDARRRGIEPLLILDYGNKFYDNGKLPRSPGAIDGFVRFATFVVKHFDGRVRYYEVWNEWNTGTGGYYPGGSAKAYARLFDATYAAIKRIDPNAVVLTGGAGASPGVNHWYERLAKLGVAARADGVAVHPYVWNKERYHTSLRSSGAERSVQQVISYEAIMRRISGKQIPLYITEIGWPTSTRRGGYPQEEAAALAERSLLMFAALPYVRGVWWYDLINDGPDAGNLGDHFGLFRQSHAFKPIGDAVRSIAPLLKHNDLNWNSASKLSAGLVVLSRGRAAHPSVIAWAVQPPSEHSAETGAIEAISCSPSLKVVRVSGKSPAADLPIDAVPTIFTYRAGRCTSEPLIAR